MWNGNLVLPGGEVRPGTRTNRGIDGNSGATARWFPHIRLDHCWYLLFIGNSHQCYSIAQYAAYYQRLFLGGGKNTLVGCRVSIFGSKLSALTFIAIPAKAYATDWVYLLNNVMIVVVAPIVVYFYLPYFRKLKLTSVYEYLNIRFNRNVKWLGSLTFVLFQVSRLGIVIYLPALVLSAVTGIDIFLCIVGTSVITTAYSGIGWY